MAPQDRNYPRGVATSGPTNLPRTGQDLAGPPKSRAGTRTVGIPAAITPELCGHLAAPTSARIQTCGLRSRIKRDEDQPDDDDDGFGGVLVPAG